MFLYKNLFFRYLLFFQSQSCLLESTAAIFRQSTGYVLSFSRKIFYHDEISEVKLVSTCCFPFNFYGNTKNFKSISQGLRNSEEVREVEILYFADDTCFNCADEVVD